jgi:adenosyl cobinamide kinase/adenosyl cobinamide phosphate guanylyltransferase
MITLVIGGARSGKSTFAEQLALARGGSSVLYIATAQALDDEMRERIAKHRAERPQEWQTLEAPRELPEAISQHPSLAKLVLLDCITLWVTNEMLADETRLEERLMCQLDYLMQWVRIQEIGLIVVSNEVGLGIVPENALARRFRDILGRVNARIAQEADEVHWMIAGLAVDAKKLAVNIQKHV